MPVWREARVARELRVRVRGVDYNGNLFVQDTYTTNISRRGARLEWLSGLKGAGETVEVQCGREKGRFRVIWIGQVGTREDSQIGICSLEPTKCIWGVPLPPPIRVSEPEAAKTAPPGAGTPLQKRRKRPRYRCRGGVQVWQEGAQAPQGGTLSEISVGGCYIETSWPLPVGTHVELLLRALELEVRAKGIVGYGHPSMGMGIAFGEITTEDRDRLQELTGLLAAPSPGS